MAEEPHAAARPRAQVPLADACVTEWRSLSWPSSRVSMACHSLMLVLLNGGTWMPPATSPPSVPLADACVTEWRTVKQLRADHPEACHSLMLVLLNGGTRQGRKCLTSTVVPLADACVTEWRCTFHGGRRKDAEVPLADACVTEWRHL